MHTHTYSLQAATNITPTTNQLPTCDLCYLQLRVRLFHLKSCEPCCIAAVIYGIPQTCNHTYTPRALDTHTRVLLRSQLLLPTCLHA